jgi:hypothetical protein
MLIAVRSARKSGLAVVAALALLAACGCRDEAPAPAPRDISGPAKRVAEAVDRLEAAVRARDYGAICADVLTPAARRHAGGSECPRALAGSFGKPRGAHIDVLSIELDGPRAEARVRTRSRGRAQVEETLLLERAGRDYRVAALAR